MYPSISLHECINCAELSKASTHPPPFLAGTGGGGQGGLGISIDRCRIDYRANQGALRCFDTLKLSKPKQNKTFNDGRHSATSATVVRQVKGRQWSLPTFNFACVALDKVSFVEIANTRPHACSTIVSDHMQGYDATSGARMRREWGDNGATWGDNGRQELAQTHAEFAQTHANSATPAAIDHLQHMALAEHTCWHQNMHTPRLCCVDDVVLLS